MWCIETWLSDGLGSTGLMVDDKSLSMTLEIFSNLNDSMFPRKGRVQLDYLHLLLKDAVYISNLLSAVNFQFTLGMKQRLLMLEAFNKEFIQGSAL